MDKCSDSQGLDTKREAQVSPLVVAEMGVVGVRGFEPPVSTSRTHQNSKNYYINQQLTLIVV